MNIPVTAVEVITLGRFSISVEGKTVATNWPDDELKVLFCCLLSPLDLIFTWDRIGRSLWGDSVTESRRKLEERLVGPLTSFLIKELGFSPLIVEDEGIKIDQNSLYNDAVVFQNAAVEGLRLMSQGSHAAAFDAFSRAKSLYAGVYLPGITGNIIAATRNELESLYLTAVLDAMPQTRKSFVGGKNPITGFGQHLNESRRPYQADLA
jgi:hypothetical protein